MELIFKALIDLLEFISISLYIRRHFSTTIQVCTKGNTISIE